MSSSLKNAAFTKKLNTLITTLWTDFTNILPFPPYSENYSFGDGTYEEFEDQNQTEDGSTNTIPKDKVQCDICQNIFATIAVLKVHKVATHGIQEQLSKSFCSATTQLSCRICGHVYKGVFALKSFKSHIQKKHGVKDLSNIKRFYEASINTGKSRNSYTLKI